MESLTNQIPALILMTKWPLPGQCKTRLAEKIGSQNASRIQSRLIEHTIAVAKRLEEEGLAEIQVALSGVSSKEAQEWAFHQGLKKVFKQGDGDLGLRMRRQVLLAQEKQQIENHGRPTILIGSDLPSLCQLDLIEAIKTLERHEIVLGPSFDGGYWLMGLAGKLVKTVPSWPFYGIQWGANQVLEETLIRAKEAGVSHGLLREHNDIDQLEDLLPWQG